VGSSRLEGEEVDRAVEAIQFILLNYDLKTTEIITGDAQGIDRLVSQLDSDCNVTVIKAKYNQWIPAGYKERNMKIAQLADYIYTIATKKIHDRRCYHCDEQNHDRTGGCWTRRYAIDKLGKEGDVIII